MSRQMNHTKPSPGRRRHRRRSRRSRAPIYAGILAVVLILALAVFLLSGWILKPAYDQAEVYEKTHYKACLLYTSIRARSSFL